MMFIVVLSLCLASSLAKPSIGLPYVPLSSPLSAWSLPYSSWWPTTYSHPTPVLSHLHEVPAYHVKNLHGISYGHSEPYISHQATQDAAGNKAGSFSYVKPDGQVHRTDYVADGAGYRVLSNDLPVAPAPVHSLHKRSIYQQAAPLVTPSGHLADTPEVAQAKAAHFAEHAKRGNYHLGLHSTPYVSPYSALPYSPAIYSSVSPSYYSGSYVHHQPAPAANIVVTPSGYLADTPEVAAAKAAHLAEKAKLAPAHAGLPLYHQPTSYPHVSPSGHIADTPEVAQAKAAHFAEYAAAAARNAALSHESEHEYEHEYVPSAPSTYYNLGSVLRPSQYYSGHLHAVPQAVPVVTPSGHLADTPEVAQAKAAHLAEYAAIASRTKRSVITPAGTSPLLGHPTPLVAPWLAESTPLISHPTPLVLPLAQPSLAYSHLPWYNTGSHSAVVHGPHAVSYQSSSISK